MLQTNPNSNVNLLVSIGKSGGGGGDQGCGDSGGENLYGRPVPDWHNVIAGYLTKLLAIHQVKRCRGMNRFRAV